MTNLARGQLLRGKYRIKRVLGEGGMGVVVRATHLRLERDVAIKMLRPGTALDESIVTRFGREARSAARLTGDHVVKVLDVDDSEGGVPFLVMEYLEGSDLEAIVRRDGPLAPALAADYALQALEGLAQAHRLGIVHRDVKPANLFLAKSEQGEIVKLLDFGISKAMLDVRAPSLTRADRIVGSPSFMSPEQAKGVPDIDARTDLWSIGVVLYYLVSGKLPFSGVTPIAITASITSDLPGNLDEAQPDLPAGFSEVVRHCMEKDRTKRFATVAEVATALAPFAPRGQEAAERIAQILQNAASPSSPSKDDEDAAESSRSFGLPHLPGTDPGATSTFAVRLDASGGAQPPESGNDLVTPSVIARAKLPKIPGTDPDVTSEPTRPEGKRASERELPVAKVSLGEGRRDLPRLPGTDAGVTKESLERIHYKSASSEPASPVTSPATPSPVLRAALMGVLAFLVVAIVYLAWPTSAPPPATAENARTSGLGPAAPATIVITDPVAESVAVAPSASVALAVAPSASVVAPAESSLAPRASAKPRASGAPSSAPSPSVAPAASSAPKPFDLDLK